MTNGSSTGESKMLSVELTGYVEVQTVDAGEVAARIKVFEEWLVKLKEQVCEKPEGTSYTYSDLATYFLMWITDPTGDKSIPDSQQGNPVWRPGVCGGP